MWLSHQTLKCPLYTGKHTHTHHWKSWHSQKIRSIEKCKPNAPPSQRYAVWVQFTIRRYSKKNHTHIEIYGLRRAWRVVLIARLVAKLKISVHCSRQVDSIVVWIFFCFTHFKCMGACVCVLVCSYECGKLSTYIQIQSLLYYLLFFFYHSKSM